LHQQFTFLYIYRMCSTWSYLSSRCIRNDISEWM